MTRIRSALISYLTPVRLYLFNDLLVITEKTVHTFRFSFQSELMETFAVETEDDRFKHVFKIVSINNTAILSCKTEEEKRYWIAVINTAISDLLDNKNPASKVEYVDTREQLAETLKVREPQGQSDYVQDYKKSKGSFLFKKDSFEQLKVPGVGFIPNEKKKEDEDLLHMTEIRRLARPPTQENVLSSDQPVHDDEEEEPEIGPEKTYELESKSKRKSDLFSNPNLASSSNSSQNNSTAISQSSNRNPDPQPNTSKNSPYSAVSLNSEEKTSLLSSQTNNTTPTNRSQCSCSIM